MFIVGDVWHDIGRKAAVVHDSSTSAGMNYQRKQHTTRSDSEGFLFPRHVNKVLHNKQVLQLCHNQLLIYKNAEIDCQFNLTDMVELMCMAEQFARYLRILNSYDIKLMQKKEVDHRLITTEDLQIGCNLISRSFFKAHTASNDLHPDTYYINALLQRQVNATYIPPIIRAVSEVSSTINDRYDLTNILSHLKITNSATTTNANIEQARNKYKSDIKDNKPIVYAVDNIDIAKTKHLHSIEKEDSTYYHGTNEIAIQPNITVPSDKLSTIRKPVTSIDSTFVHSSLTQLDCLHKFEHLSFTRSLSFYRDNQTPELTTILNPVQPAVIPDDTSSSPPPIQPMEKVIGLNTTTPGITLSDIQHKITDGKPSDPHILKQVLTNIVNSNPDAAIIFVTADQAIFDIFQQIKDHPDFHSISQKISMDMEIWHCQLTMDKAIMTSYLTPLKPLLVALGYISDSHVQYLVKCANLHRTHYNLEPIMVAIQIEMIAQFLRDNPTYTNEANVDNDLYQPFNIWLENKKKDNPHLKLWSQFVNAFNKSNAAWVAQRIGDYQLFKSSITLDGFSPLFFSWGRCNYDHSIVEQLLKDFLDSPYEEYVKSNNSHFLRYKSSNVLMPIGTKQEMFVKYVKSFITKLIEDNKVTKTAEIMTPIEINKQNLHELLSIPPKYKHKLHNMDIREINNVRCFIQKYNILGFLDSSPAEFTITNNERSQTSEDMGIDSLLLEDGINEEDYEDIPSPQNSEIDYEYHENSTMPETLPSLNNNLSDIQIALHFLKVSEHGNPQPLDDKYWTTLQTESSIAKINSHEPIDWYSKTPVNPQFLDSFENGRTMMQLFAEQLVKHHCTTQTSHLKIPIKKDLANITYEKKTNSKSNQKPQIQQIDKSSREIIADAASSSTTTTANIQNFDIQFSKDGHTRHKPAKSNLKSILKEKFEHSYLGQSKTINSQYSGIAIDSTYILYHQISKNNSVSDHTEKFVNTHITPYLAKSNQLILAFDVDQFSPILKCQERYERSLKTEENLVPKTVRAFESSTTVPLLVLRRQDRSAREHYCKMIVKELTTNCKKYLSSCCGKDFLIVISGISLTTDQQHILPLYIFYHHNINIFEINTTPALHHSLGQGEDAVFFLADTIDNNSESKWLFVSPDTDIITKALAIHNQVKFKIHVALPSPQSREYTLFDIDKLCTWICASYSNLTYPIETFVVLLLDNGFCDFTSAWYGIGLKKSLEIFETGICHDLLTPNPDQSLTAEQLQLLKWPDSVPFPSLPSLKKAVVRRATRTVLKKYEAYSYDELLPIVFKEKENARHSFPTSSGLESHFFRIVLAFLHFTSLSRNNAICNDIEKFGFLKIDPNQAVSIENCRFDFNAKTVKMSNVSKVLCSAINKSNKQQCSRYAIQGSAYCTQHKRSIDEVDETKTSHTKSKKPRSA